MAGNTQWEEEEEMTQRYLRNVNDGFIYGWNPILAKNALCVEVTEEEAFPERFVNKKIVSKAKKARAKRGAGLDLTTGDTADEPVYVAPEIEEDASRNLPE